MTRSRLRKSIWTVTLAAFVAGVLTLVACGGSGSTASTASSSPSATSSIPSFSDVIAPTPVSAATALPAPTVAGTIAFVKMVKVAKGYNSEIFTVRTDGTGLKQLTDDPWWEEAPAWSPDGRRIAYSVWTEDDVHTSGVWVMNADGSGKKNLTKGAPPGVAPTWSPDGKQIVFCAQEKGREGLVYRMNTDGSGVKPLGGGVSVPDTENGGGLEWAPDGKILLYQSTGSYGDVFAVNQDGSGLTRLTEGAKLGLFAMSPDGAKLALHDVMKRLYVSPVQGDAAGQVTLLDDTTGYVLDPFTRVSWSSDGRALTFSSSGAYLSHSDDGSYLFVVNADGTGLSRVPGIERVFDPAWQPE